MPQYEDTMPVFDLAGQAVVELEEDEFAARARGGEPLTRALPPRLGEDGHALYHDDPRVSSLIAAAARALVRGRDDLQGLAEAIFYAEDPGAMTMDMLLDAAADEESVGSGRAREFLGLAMTLEDRVAATQQLNSEQSGGPLWDAQAEAAHAVGRLGQTRLSRGETLAVDMTTVAHTQAERLVMGAIQLIEKPFADIISGLRTSMEAALADKQNLLRVVHGTEERRDLQVEILALQANLRCCATFLLEGADYHSYQAIAQRLTTETQDAIAEGRRMGDIDVGETALQALSSLKEQLMRAVGVRNNASVYLYGAQGDAGLAAEAVSSRKRRLSTTHEDDVLVIDSLAAQSLGSVLEARLAEHQVRITSSDDVLVLCRRYSLEHVVLSDGRPVDLAERERQYREGTLDPQLRQRVDTEVADVHDLLLRIAEQGGQSLDQMPFADFVAQTYVISERDDWLDQLRAQFWRQFSPAVDLALEAEQPISSGYEPGSALRELYDTQLADVVQQIDLGDMIAAAEQHETERLGQSFVYNLASLLDQLEIRHANRAQFVAEHQDEVGDVLLAAYELQRYANDIHLNAAAALRELAQARFNGTPMTPMILRCLRWCYPNRQLEIAPHAGDYDTKGPDGEYVKRNEWVEREKLRIYYDAVVRVLEQHNIPITGVTFVAAGDYDLEAPGYSFGPDDRPRQDALSYVASLPGYIRKWGVLPEDMPIRVITLKELAAQVGQDVFDTALRFVEGQYDALFQDNSRSFLGLSARRLEQVIDQEHEHRLPFNAGWTRETSRAFTRFRVTRELAYGLIIGQMAGARMLTLSGNAASGFTFSKGGEIARQMQASGYSLTDVRTDDLPVTMMLSVNDGTQSKMWQRQSTVVT